MCNTTRRARGLSPLTMAIQLALGSLLIVSTPAVTAAQVEARQYDIPAGDLGRALNRYASDAGVAISFDASQVQGLRTQGLQGNYAVSEGFAQLLRGSDLQARPGTNGYTLEAVPKGDVLQLTSIDIVGVSDEPSEAELEAQTYRGAGTSAYISRENIERFRGSSPGDMLTGIPGVLNGDNRNSGALDVNIRGMQGQGRTPVVLDGAMQESTVSRGYLGIAGRSYVDPDFIGGISIEKGPSSGPDASGAIGGVVRARTINAGDVVAPDGSWGLLVRGGLQNNNVAPPHKMNFGAAGEAAPERNYDRPSFFDMRGFSGSLVAAHRSEMFDFVAGYARRQNGNYYSGSKGLPATAWSNSAKRFIHDEQVINTASENTSYLLRSVFRPTDDHTLDLSYMRYKSLFAEMKPSQMMYGTGIYQTATEVEADTYTGRYRYKPQNPLIDFHADLWRSEVETLTLNPSPIRRWFNQDSFAATLSERQGATFYNVSRFSGEPGDLALTYGLAYDNEDFGKSQKWKDYYSRYPNATARYVYAEKVPEGWRRQRSSYLNAEYKPVPWATFSAGVRKVKSEVQSDTAGTSWVQGGLKNHEQSSGYAPSLSALVEPLPGFQLYMRYAESIRGASPYEGSESFSATYNPYTNLKPEHAHNTEAGFNFMKYGLATQDDLLQLKVGWFSNDINNYITYGTQVVTNANGQSTNLDVRTNIPQVTMRGVEISARYEVGNLFTSVGATEYGSMKFCYDDYSGNRGVACFDSMPSTATSWFTNQVPPKRTLSATVGANFFDERVTIGARYNNVQTEPAYEIVDLFGTYKVTDDTAVSFTVDNLFDKYYSDALSLGSVQRLATLPAPGRTLRLSLSTSFGDGARQRTSAAETRARIAAAAAQTEPLLEDFNGNWSGWYVGANWGGIHYDAKGSTTSGNGQSSSVAASEATERNKDAALAGLHIGYNHQLDSGLVLGAEVGGSYARARVTQNFIVPELNARFADNRKYQATYKQSFGPEVSARLRVGQTFGRALVYATAGVSVMQEKQRRTQYRAITPYNTETRTYFSESDSKLRAGGVIGAGVEYAFSDKVSLRSEYLYGYYPEKTFDFDRASQNVYANSGSDVAIGREASNTLKTQSVQLGFNYRF